MTHDKLTFLQRFKYYEIDIRVHMHFHGNNLVIIVSFNYIENACLELKTSKVHSLKGREIFVVLTVANDLLAKWVTFQVSR